MALRTRSVASLLGLMLLCLGPAPLCAAPIPGSVRLKSGKVLQGRVVARERVQGQTLLKIETDFGNLLVPETQTVGTPEVEAAPEPIFHARAVRVVRIEGRVERRPPGAAEWSAVSFDDAYGKRRRPDELVQPGDTVRTAEKAALDLMLHRDVWVRVAEKSEVEIPLGPARPTLHLLQGSVAQQVEGRPRGGEFRVGTPTTVLGVRGTVFAVRVSSQDESVTTTHGTVRVGDAADVGPGSTGRWSGTGPVAVTPSSPRELAEVPALFARLPLDDLVLVPAGRYRQGGQSTQDPDDRDAVYRREHERVIEEFWIGRTEVPCAAYELFVHATGARRPGDWAAGPLTPEAANKPIVGIGREAARAFAAWTGSDLPGEAQWEAAARGPRGFPRPWGSASAAGLRIHRPDRAADLHSVEGPTDDISPVGCLQMASNAAELCGDMDNYQLMARTVQEYGAWDDLAVRGGFSTLGRVSSQYARLPVGLRIARTDVRLRR